MLRGLRRCAEHLTLNKICFYVLFGLLDIFRLAQIAPVVFVGAEGLNLFTLRCQPQICRDDGENAFFSQQRKDPRRDHVNAGECKFGHLL